LWSASLSIAIAQLEQLGQRLSEKSEVAMYRSGIGGGTDGQL